MAFTTHFKDMGVEEYREGFLLSEVPLGTGVLDLPRVIRTLRAAHPEIRFNLEMITRDPLEVPCLAVVYWATFPDLPGKDDGPRFVARPRPSSGAPFTSHQSAPQTRAASSRRRKRQAMPCIGARPTRPRLLIEVSVTACLPRKP